MAPAGRPALSRRDGLRSAQPSVKSRRSGKGGGGIVLLGDITFEDLCREQLAPQQTSRGHDSRCVPVVSQPAFACHSSAAGRWLRILSSLVQEWVTKATAEGLAPRSVRKYHVMLHSIFERAVRDQLILMNPASTRSCPRYRAADPDADPGSVRSPGSLRSRSVTGCSSATAIETGMRWGELIALRPRHIDFLRRTVTVEETIVEVSKKHSVYR